MALQFLGPEDLLRRVQSEFREMPGLRLTTAQAQRLFNLNGGTCEEVLARLVASGFLARTADGSFVCQDTGSPVR